MSQKPIKTLDVRSRAQWHAWLKRQRRLREAVERLAKGEKLGLK